MHNYLIAGGDGFVGSSLSSVLQTYGIASEFVSRKKGFDLSIRESHKNLNPNVSGIINLASLVGVEESWNNPESFFSTNYMITLNLLEHARINKLKLVHVSSYVYGQPKIQPISEQHQIAAYNPYAATKILTEDLCRYYSQLFGVSIKILRPFNIYGSRQSRRFIIPSMIQQALKFGVVRVNSLLPKRDYLWVDDFSEAIYKSLSDPDPKLKIYNVGYGKTYSTADIINVIRQYVPGIVAESDDVLRKNEVMDCVSDSRAFRDRYNWAPRVDIDTGIKKLIDEAVS